MNITELLVILGASLAAGLVGARTCRRRPWTEIGPGTAQWLAIGIILTWVTLVGTLAILKHVAFNSGAYDLGIFDQTIWNSAQGRLFHNSVMADSPSFLGHHFSPLLMSLVPFYWVYPNPVTLLAVQAVMLGLAGLPIFWMARDHLGSSGLALAVLVAYLLNPATAYIALFDFHELALVVPLLALALCFLLRRCYGWFGVTLFLSLLAKEDIGLVGFGLGLFIALFQRRRLIGLGVCTVSIAWTLLLVRYIIPSFHPEGTYYFTSLYTNLGSEPAEVLSNLVSRPIAILSEVVAPTRLRYLQQLVAPLGGLPILGWPGLIVALPTFLSLALSDRLPSELIRYQYSASLLPVLLTATVLGLRWLRARGATRTAGFVPGLVAFVLTASVIGAYLYGPLPFARQFEPRQYQGTPRLDTARQLIAQIPPQASVIAQANLVPHLAHRPVIQVFNYADPILRPDFYFVDTDKNASRFPIQQDDEGQYQKSIARIRADADYRLVADREGYLLFQREPPERTDLASAQSVGMRFGDSIVLEAYSAERQALSSGGTLVVTLYWRAEREMDVNYTAFAHLVDADGTRWGQHDEYPVSAYLPTSEWEPGRVLRATWEIPIAGDTPTGEYQLLIGLYDLTTMKRLPAIASDGQPSGDSAHLLEVHVDHQS